MRFILIGPNQGATKVLGGFQFVDGSFEVKGSQQDFDNARRVLSRYYSAYPEHELVLVEGKYLLPKDVPASTLTGTGGEPQKSATEADSAATNTIPAVTSDMIFEDTAKGINKQ